MAKISASEIKSCVLNEVGYLEKRSNYMLDNKTANAGYNNYTKYTRDVDNSGLCDAQFQGQAWCCGFVMWPFLHLYGKAEAQRALHLPTAHCKAYNCGELYDYFKAANAIHSVPEVGDVVFFRSYNSNGTIRYNYAHVGIVVEVTSTSIVTVEGNTSGASGVIANGGGVCKKSYARNYRCIVGYGRPKYDISVTPVTPTPNYNVTVNTRMLSKGMKGNDVHNVMVLLHDMGYYTASVPKYDNEFGPNMQAAVKAFQKAKGLSADGIIGKDTWSKLLQA